MRHVFAVGLCALCAMAAVSNAAQITFQTTDTTTAPNAWSTMYGSADYMVFDFSSGKPDVAGGYTTKTGIKPSYVADFYWGTPGSGGGGAGGGGGGSGSVIAQGDLYYDLVLNEGKSFQFTSLFYDDTYGADNGLAAGEVALKVRLLGPNDLDDAWHELTVAQLQSGTFLSWDVVVYQDDIAKSITMDVDYAQGAGVAAAGFFLDDVQDAGSAPIPEPATISLMMFGLAGIFVRSKRKA